MFCKALKKQKIEKSNLVIPAAWTLVPGCRLPHSVCPACRDSAS